MKKDILENITNEAKTEFVQLNIIGTENTHIRILQCIGIICVVMGHVGCNVFSFGNWLPYASFHMPLFFFVSGYFFSPKTLRFRSFVRIFTRLIIPFYIFYVMYWFIVRFLNAYWGCSFTLANGFVDYLLAPILKVQPVGFLSPSWFVISLAFVKLIHYCIWKLLSKIMCSDQQIHMFITFLYVCVGVFVFGIGTGQSEIIRNMQKIAFWLSFYQCGSLYSEHQEDIDGIHWYVYFGTLIVIRELLWIRYGWTSIAFYSFDNIEEGYFPVFLSAVVGILLWCRITLIISKKVETNGILVKIGRSTFDIMVNHLFVIFLLQGIGLFVYTRLFGKQYDFSVFKSSVYYVAGANPILPMLLTILSVLIISYFSEQKKRIKQKIARICSTRL